ncbi:hypothetical protein [Saliphagus sp. LR7]|uniref:hypothetical protein n=1 Tax=Saliphagus sp. LR7 TaxID=2282654 RepID=UPI001E4D352B|nr:hypothetical protein [Saliphagus sp. LR7]
MLSKIANLIKFPGAARRRLKVQLVRPFVDYPYNTISYTEEDWDNLIILDACRFDTFYNNNIYDEEPKQVHSNSCHTTEFLENNFSKQNHDTVYVTASPQVVGYEENFHRVYHVWDTHWDEEHATVLPQDVNQVAIDAAETHPNKRLIIHYMQPHYPFIGPTADQIGVHGTFTGGQRQQQYASVWDLLSAGKVDSETVKKAYEENLQIILPYVQELTDTLIGKTVVTSDHGNLFGKRVTRLPIKIEAHPPGVPDPELTAVPWLELPYSSRKEIVAESPDSIEKTARNVTERLRDLGYME